MNTEKRKIISIAISFLLIFGFAANIFSTSESDAGESKLYKKRISYKYGNNLHNFYHIKIESKTAFCVELHETAYNGEKYNKTSYKKQKISNSQWEKLNKIANIGYNSKRKSEAWYAATQMVIWKQLIDWKIKGNEGGDITFLEKKISVPGYKDKIKIIKKELSDMEKAFKTAISFDKSVIKGETGKSLTKTFTDKNKVISNLEVKSVPKGVKTKITGNRLKVTVSNNSKNGYILFKPKVNKSLMKETAYFYSPSSQNVASIGKPVVPTKGKLEIKLKEPPKDVFGDFSFTKSAYHDNEADFSLLKEKPDFTKIEFEMRAAEDIKDVRGNIKYKNDTLVQRANPDSKGNVSFKKFLPGRYHIKETKTAPGLIRNNKPIDVIATRDKSSVTVFSVGLDNNNTFINEPTKIKISKLDITGSNEIPGAKLELREESGALIKSWTSGEKPYYIEGLNIGKKYIIIEKLAPTGYVKTVKKIKFTVLDTGKVQKQKIKNKQLLFFKTDKNGRIIKGGKFKVTDMNGNVIFEFEGHKSAQGEILEKNYGIPISELSEGERYILKETEPPVGYGFSKDISFRVNTGEKDEIIKMIDEKSKIRTKATLQKNLNKVYDKVSYSNLIPGKKYRLVGWLVDVKTKKFIEGTRREKEFIPAKEFGSLKLRFEAKNVGEGRKVVFEECYDSAGNLVGEHKDINDKNQTVNFPKKKTEKQKKKLSKSRKAVRTGEKFPLKLIICFLICSAIGTLVTLIYRPTKHISENNRK